MSKKLGLAKDLGKAFGLGAINGFVRNAVLCTIGSVVVQVIQGEEIDLVDGVTKGAIGAGVLAVIQGTCNVAGNLEGIQMNYALRSAQDELETIITSEEIVD